MIASSAEPVCNPLRAWLQRVASFRAAPGSQKQSLDSQPWATQEGIAAALTAFQEACHRDLHGHVARLRLYLEDDRTVSVLLRHVQDRIVDEYMEFKMTIMKELGTGVRTEIVSEEAVQLLLRDVCESGGPVAASTST